MKKLFYNGKIYTGDADKFANYVVVNDNRIAEVGSDIDAGKFDRDSDTEKIDLQGRMLLPGFIDAHAHPFTSAFQLSQIVLSFQMDEAEILDTVHRYIRQHPEKNSYFGIGYAEPLFGEEGPRRETLDKICPDKPIILVGASGHEAWTNSKALAAAKIDRNHPDPVPGFQLYRRDKNGEATGHLLESGPIAEIVYAIDPFVLGEAEETLLKIFDSFSSYGVTTIIDCGFICYIEKQAELLLDRMIEKGLLKQRIFGSNLITERRHLKNWEPHLRELRKKYNSDLVRVNTFKVVNDGTIESYSASMSEPFEGFDATVDPLAFGKEYQELCVEAAGKGYDLHLHGIGDRTIHENLMAAKAVRESGFKDTIITNAHTQCVRDADIPLFAELNVIANTTGVWHYGDPNADKALGKRAGKTFRMKRILECGGKMSLGSDFPGDEYGPQPLNSIETGVTRQLCGRPESPILEPVEERLPVEELIKGYTITPAYQARMDKKLGTIEPGKYADFVVLGKDIFETAPYQIHEIPVYMTVMDGAVTYRNQE